MWNKRLRKNESTKQQKYEIAKRAKQRKYKITKIRNNESEQLSESEQQREFETTKVQNDGSRGLHSPGLLDNNPEQIRNKLKISAYVLETT